MNFFRADNAPCEFKNNYPFPFLKNYSRFCKEYENAEVLFFFSENRQAIAPAKIYNIQFLRVLRFLFPPLHLGKEISQSDEKEFIEEVVQFIIQKKLCHRILQPENFCLFRTYPSNSVHAPYGTYRVNLELNTEELLSNLQPRYRSAIRNAQKSGTVVKQGWKELANFYSLYQSMTKRKGIYCESYEYFRCLFQFMEESHALCRVVYLNDIPLGGIFLLFSEFSAFYLHGCSATDTRTSGLIKFLHWDTMMLLKKMGVKQYDFVGARARDISGTNLEGVQQFKKRFGGEFIKGVLWKMDINRKQCKLFDVLLQMKMAVKRRKPMLDIIDQEIRWRNINEKKEKHPIHF